MSEVAKQKQKVLVADDSEMNRMLLREMLGDEFDVMEVENGRQAVDYLSVNASEISLLLLDIMMPEMDGFEVLEYMNHYRLIDDVPVIIISAENSPSYIERAYDLGVTDFVNRPFDAAIVRRRVSNTILLSAKQRRLMAILTDQIYEREKSNRLMINVLSHIVEFRNGESGAHVVHINWLTRMFLTRMAQKHPGYKLTAEMIDRISMASALHDVGKLSVPDEILNKPGKLTDEEFARMKLHTVAGADMLEALPQDQREDPLVQAAVEICRWHHERYDGRGYPDGLKGEEIPISAQVVALADVYDALTSERCYKKAFSHETAMEMILGGQCGTFNPELLEILKESDEMLKSQLHRDSIDDEAMGDMRHVVDQLHSFEISSSDWMIQQMEFERQRAQYLAASIQVPMFTYTAHPPVLSFNERGTEALDVRDTIADPIDDPEISGRLPEEDIRRLCSGYESATAEQPDFQAAVTWQTEIGAQSYLCDCHTLWSQNDGGIRLGMVGRLSPRKR